MIAAENRPGIAVPPRASAVGTALVLALAALLAAVMFLGGAPAFYVAGGMAVLAAAGLAAGELAAVHLGMFAALATAIVASRLLRPWPLPLVVALVLHLNVVLLVPRLRAFPSWVRAGTIDRTTGALVAATIAVSAVALVIWTRLARPDLATFLKAVPVAAPWAVMLLGAGFALVNAAAEEAAYRGVLMQSLDAALGPSWASVAVQAAAFGCLHRHGFPGGPSGMVLAGIYGLMLGMIRRRSRGLLAPWIAHVAADVAIFGIVVGMNRGPL